MLTHGAVCVKMVAKIDAALTAEQRKDMNAINGVIKSICKTATGKENRFVRRRTCPSVHALTGCLTRRAPLGSATTSAGPRMQPLTF
jgi:hypothetical protein